MPADIKVTVQSSLTDDQMADKAMRILVECWCHQHGVTPEYINVTRKEKKHGNNVS